MALEQPSNLRNGRGIKGKIEQEIGVRNLAILALVKLIIPLRYSDKSTDVTFSVIKRLL